MSQSVEYELLEPPQVLRTSQATATQRQAEWMAALEPSTIATRIATERAQGHCSVDLLELKTEPESSGDADGDDALEEELNAVLPEYNNESVYERVRNSLPADCQDARIRIAHGQLTVQWEKPPRFKCKHLVALCSIFMLLCLCGLFAVIGYCNEPSRNCTRITVRST